MKLRHQLLVTSIVTLISAQAFAYQFTLNNNSQDNLVLVSDQGQNVQPLNIGNSKYQLSWGTIYQIQFRPNPNSSAGAEIIGSISRNAYNYDLQATTNSSATNFTVKYSSPTNGYWGQYDTASGNSQGYCKADGSAGITCNVGELNKGEPDLSVTITGGTKIYKQVPIVVDNNTKSRTIDIVDSQSTILFKLKPGQSQKFTSNGLAYYINDDFGAKQIKLAKLVVNNKSNTSDYNMYRMNAKQTDQLAAENAILAYGLPGQPSQGTFSTDFKTFTGVCAPISGESNIASCSFAPTNSGYEAVITDGAAPADDGYTYDAGSWDASKIYQPNKDKRDPRVNYNGAEYVGCWWVQGGTPPGQGDPSASPWKPYKSYTNVCS